MKEPANMVRFIKAILALQEYVESVYGLFHDASVGWKAHSARLANQVELAVKAGENANSFLNSIAVYGDGAGPDGTVIPMQESTFREVLNRCEKGGMNECYLAGMCLVAFYSYWETETRNEIAASLVIDRESTLTDLFGDLRAMRIALLHTGSKADARVANAKILTWFKLGDLVKIDRAKLHYVVERIREMPNGLSTDGFEPPDPSLTNAQFQAAGRG